MQKYHRAARAFKALLSHHISSICQMYSKFTVADHSYRKKYISDSKIPACLTFYLAITFFIFFIFAHRYRFKPYIMCQSYRHGNHAAAAILDVINDPCLQIGLDLIAIPGTSDSLPAVGKLPRAGCRH